MDDQDLRDLKASVKTINGELGAVWREMAKLGTKLAKVATDVHWLKNIVWKGLVPVLVGILVLLITILVKLLIG